MDQYRNQSNIDSEKLVRLMHGSREKYERFQKVAKIAEEVGYVADIASVELSRVDQVGRAHQLGLLFKKMKAINFMSDDIPDYFLYLTNTHVKGGVGLLMTLHLIKVLGTEKQVQDWAVPIAELNWYACYAQTELSHGSDVQELKTTATFDRTTQEWVLHTPDIGAIKWWPGDLGISATHGIVMARLISNGKDHGVYPFFIQLRDLETHKVLPGMEIGDIGPKLGYAAKDNGFLRFFSKRVPKDALLGKYYQIDAEGNFKTVGNPKIIYASMMESRTAIIKMHCAAVFKCLQIVGRYSTLRKQFRDSKGNELPIIEYQLQKYKLLKFVSRGMAMVFSVHRLDSFLKKNSESVKKNNFSYLQEAHIYLCGFKAYHTWTGVQCYTEMIQAAGGHGYSYYSGLVSSMTELFPDTILEGENSLLCLQISRHLLKSLKHVQEGKGDKIKGATKYITRIDELMEFKLPEEKEALCNRELLIKSLARVSSFFVRDAAIGMMQHVSQGIDPKDAWNTKMGVKLLAVGKLHTIYTIGFEANADIEAIEDPLIREVLLDVILYFLIESIEEYAAYFLQSETLTGDQLGLLKEHREELIDKLSPHLLKLCEAYQISDTLMWSAIGHSNGKPYENLYDWARQYGSLNKYAMEGHPSILQYKL